MVRQEVTAPSLGVVEARLAAEGGDWDLAVFDARGGRTIAGGTTGGPDEVAQGFVLHRTDLIVQACRRSGGDDAARLSLGHELVGVGSGPAEVPSLVRVAVSSEADVARLQSLGFDLTEHGGPGFVDAVLHGADDGARLTGEGFSYDVLVANLTAQSAQAGFVARGPGASPGYAFIMPLLALLFFIGLPIAELYVIIQVGGAIGVLPTIALLIADSFLGAALLRSQGRAAWRRFNLALAEGRVPAGEVFDGAMIILGGALLLTPGFITDAFGLFLLIPPTRALIRGFVGRMARRRVSVGWVFGGPGYPGRGPGDPPRPGPGPGSGSRGYDYEGTATEVRDHREISSPNGDDRA